MKKLKKFWVVSVNNYICDASYSGKELKEKHLFPRFRQFTYIREIEDLEYFKVREEISNIDLVNKCLNSDKNLERSVATEVKK